MPKKRTAIKPMAYGIRMPRTEEVEGMKEIVATLDKLRKKAEDTGIEDVPMIINAAYKVCLSLHYLQIRGELVEDPPAR